MNCRNLTIILALMSGCETSTPNADQQPPQPKAVTVREATPEQFALWLSEQNGKVVVVDMWATWCPPCVKEFPGLVALSKRYSPDRLSCASLSYDFQGISEFDLVKQRVLDFLQDQEATTDNFIATIESDELFEQLDIVSIPVIDVYAADGSLYKRFDLSNGVEFTYEDVNRVVDQLLEPQTP